MSIWEFRLRVVDRDWVAEIHEWLGERLGPPFDPHGPKARPDQPRPYNTRLFEDSSCAWDRFLMPFDDFFVVRIRDPEVATLFRLTWGGSVRVTEDQSPQI